jgi:hypothetical protein
MRTSSPNRKAPIGVTSGEILIGAIWFAFYCFLITASLSPNPGWLVAAITRLP